jgi:hypothetical protein
MGLWIVTESNTLWVSGSSLELQMFLYWCFGLLFGFILQLESLNWAVLLKNETLRKEVLNCVLCE